MIFAAQLIRFFARRGETAIFPDVAAIEPKSNSSGAPIFAGCGTDYVEEARRSASPFTNPAVSIKPVTFLTAVYLALSTISSLPTTSRAASAAEIDQKREGALEHKGGFIVGAQHGDGALIVNGRTVAYHNTVVVSYGFQAGVQKFGCAMFFITDASLNYLSKSGGWEVGTAPSLVVVDARMAKSLSSTTLNKGIYVFFFSQKGLMGGLGLQGTKITQYTSSAQTF